MAPGKWNEDHDMTLRTSELIGDLDSIPKEVCPLPKKTFSLEMGDNLNGDEMNIVIFAVRIKSQKVYIGFEK